MEGCNICFHLDPSFAWWFLSSTWRNRHTNIYIKICMCFDPNGSIFWQTLGLKNIYNYGKGTWFEDMSLPMSPEDVWLLDSIDLSCFLMFFWSVWRHSNADIRMIAISGDWRRALVFKLTHLSHRITLLYVYDNSLACWGDNIYVLFRVPETIAKPTEPLPGRYSKRKRFFSAHICYLHIFVRASCWLNQDIPFMEEILHQLPSSWNSH